MPRKLEVQIAERIARLDKRAAELKKKSDEVTAEAAKWRAMIRTGKKYDKGKTKEK